MKKPPKTKRYEGKVISIFLNNLKKFKSFLTRYINYIVDETGKKIRGKADGNIKDYDHYGKQSTINKIISLITTKNHNNLMLICYSFRHLFKIYTATGRYKNTVRI